MGALELRSLGIGGVADPKIHASNTCVITSNLVVLMRVRHGVYA